MQFLEEDEASLLHSILVNHTLIANEVARPDLLINCGLATLLYTLSSIGRSSLLFVNELCASLSNTRVTAKPSGQPGLIALLNYISMPPYDVDLSSEEKRFLERVKRKCQQWYELQTPQHYLAMPLLDQERQKVSLSKSVQKPVEVTRGEIIVSYGFYSLMAEFANRVNYGKASAFAVAGDFTMLRDYIIERLCHELKRRVPGPQKLLDISLTPHDMTEDEGIIEKKVMSRNRCNKLINLFEKYPKTHIVLVVWCYAFPSERLQLVATHFWQEVEADILPFLREQSQCFVLILANIGTEGRPYQVDNFTVLQTPTEFDMADLLLWVQGRLEHLGVEQSDIELCLERLRDQHGDFTRTYHEMEYIVNYLQGKYIGK